MDLFQPRPALLVERGYTHLLEQLLDHAADPHDLGRLFDHVGDGWLGLVVVRPTGRTGHGDPVRAHDDNLRLVLLVL